MQQQDVYNSAVEKKEFHPAIRIVARGVSLLFHPLFIPVYASWFLIYYTPLFPGFSEGDKAKLLVRFFIMYTMFPMVTVLLAKGLGFIQSVYLKTQKDRIIPYVACGLYYFWMWYVLKNQPQFPRELVLMSLAIFLASSLGLILNSYLKISMHAISVGVMIAFLFLVASSSAVNYGVYLSGALLLTGIVCTARLINSDHQPIEIYLGLGVGIAGQLVASFFV